MDCIRGLGRIHQKFNIKVGGVCSHAGMLMNAEYVYTAMQIVNTNNDKSDHGYILRTYILYTKK